MTEQEQFAIDLKRQLALLDQVKWECRKLLTAYKAKGYSAIPEGFDLPNQNITSAKVQNAILSLKALDTTIMADGNEDNLAAMV